MKAKEKARELVSVMILHSNCQDGAWMDEDLAKQCALIAVDELIKQEISLLGLSEKYIPTWWNMVKKEIEKL